MLVLIVLGLCLTVSQLILHKGINRQELSGNAINLAGRQRMLSQRILSYSCMGLHTNQNAEETSELLAAVTEWHKSHRILLLGSEKDGIPTPDETFEAEMLGLNETVVRAKKLVLEIIDLEEDNFLELKMMLDRYLPRMDLAVKGLATRSQASVQRLNLLNFGANALIFILGIYFHKHILASRMPRRIRRA